MECCKFTVPKLVGGNINAPVSVYIVLKLNFIDKFINLF